MSHKQIAHKCCYLQATYQDVSREQKLGDCYSMIDPLAPTLDFDGREPRWKEIQEVARQPSCRPTRSWSRTLPGKFKACMYQHGILPRIMWPFLVYEVPISTVEGFERRVSRFLKWLGLPWSLSSIILYGKNNMLKLPISSLNEEFKVSRTRAVLQYRKSSDPKVSQAGIEVRTGRRWRAAEAMDVAESQLRHRALVWTVAQGRAVLGSSTMPRYNKADRKDRRTLLQEEVRAAVEEDRASTMVGMRQQGAWTHWEQATERKVIWTEL